ncbi:MULTISPECIES: fructose-1,6-bisphosphatase [Anaerotruncus]|uniref:fructose-1,6-bisphosphatase n=1 Tax=Anaerotruncus TaxID=244127 RepID=UPI001FA898D1|nr:MULTISPECIES: fructose-1,6-bisphosphatase [Anaerotruncus]
MKQPMRAEITEHRYLQMLARQYPTVQAASTEIINLQAILNLPKGTEHFMSDLHGEYEAFLHILNNASGAVREKVDILFENSVPKDARDQLATLIYYPEEKLEEVRGTVSDLTEWYKITLNRLLEICRLVSSKYTRSKVRKALPKDYAYIIDELLNTNYEIHNKKDYYENIISTMIDIDKAEDFIIAVCSVIKTLVVDHLHIVGDIFDRGPRADIVMDSLMTHHSVDIQWGNHDVLWMGAATGSRTCIATVLVNSITYNNLAVIETGYGISLRPLALFANEVYMDVDTACFATRVTDSTTYNAKDIELGARMHKAISVILFKLEGQTILRNPEFGMDDRLLLDKIDYEKKTVKIGGKDYPLSDTDFPTVDPVDPYKLSDEETELMAQLKDAFLRSEKLQRHVKFLYSKGGLYKTYNGNLLFHGCIPMNPDGTDMKFNIGCKGLGGKAFLDHAETVARQGYYAKPDTLEKQFGKDFLWFLWCGRHSPLFGRDHITTFERRLVPDKSVWAEEKNPYYTYYEDPEVCIRLLREFGLEGPHCHIINGHVPVKSKDGENPVKAGGRLIVIDGGFCRAYQPTTGIAGYTLIYNSWGIRIASHEPFGGRKQAIKQNTDIISTSVVFERMESRIKIAETDTGVKLQQNVDDLRRLLRAFKMGEITEEHEK